MNGYCRILSVAAPDAGLFPSGIPARGVGIGIGCLDGSGVDVLLTIFLPLPYPVTAFTFAFKTLVSIECTVSI
jgi:hypothetical protein